MTKSDPFAERATRAAQPKPAPSPTSSEANGKKRRLTVDLADPEYQALRQWAFDAELPMTRLLRAGAIVASSDTATRARIEAVAGELTS